MLLEHEYRVVGWTKEEVDSLAEVLQSQESEMEIFWWGWAEVDRTSGEVLPVFSRQQAGLTSTFTETHIEQRQQSNDRASHWRECREYWIEPQ